MGDGEFDYDKWREYLDGFVESCRKLSADQLASLIKGRRDEYERTHESLELQKALIAESILSEKKPK